MIPKGSDPYLHYFCLKCNFSHSIAFFKWFYHLSYWFWWYYEKGEYAGRWEIQIQTNHVRWKSSLMSSIDLEHFHEKCWKKWWNCFQNVKKLIFINISPLFSPVSWFFVQKYKWELRSQQKTKTSKTVDYPSERPTIANIFLFVSIFDARHSRQTEVFDLF